MFDLFIIWAEIENGDHFLVDRVILYLPLMESDLIGLVIEQLNQLFIGWHRLSIKHVFSILDCVSKVLYPFIIDALIFDPKEIVLLLFVLQSHAEIVNTRAHQPTAFLYFLHTIDEGDFELFLDLVVDIQDCYFIFEGAEH